MTETNFSRIEPDYTYLSELVFKGQRYPDHLIVTTGVRDHQTGHYVSVVDKYGTTACIEVAMRLGAEKGLKALEAVFTSNPEDFKHVYKQTEYIDEDQYLVISAQLTDDIKGRFLAYMEVSEVQQIKAKDFKKALNALETTKAPK